MQKAFKRYIKTRPFTNRNFQNMVCFSQVYSEPPFLGKYPDTAKQRDTPSCKALNICSHSTWNSQCIKTTAIHAIPSKHQIRKFLFFSCRISKYSFPSLLQWLQDNLLLSCSQALKLPSQFRKATNPFQCVLVTQKCSNRRYDRINCVLLIQYFY